MSQRTELSIDRRLLGHVMARAAAQGDEEIVGVLSGSRDVATRDTPLLNVLRRPDAFLADPYAQFLAERGIASRGENIIALYHSHPMGDASFSAADAQLATPWRCAHLVLGLRPEMNVRAYRVDERGRVREIDVRAVDAGSLHAPAARSTSRRSTAR